MQSRCSSASRLSDQSLLCVLGQVLALIAGLAATMAAISLSVLMVMVVLDILEESQNV